MPLAPHDLGPMRLLLAFALAAVTVPARATPVRMDLSEAMRRAEQAAPALGPRREAMRSARQVEGAADQKLSTPPRVELEVGPRFRSDPNRVGFDATLGLWQDLPLGGLGASRRRWARAAGSEAEARLGVGVHDARTEAALAWIDARLAQELERARRESLEHARAIAKVAGARVRAGSAPPSEEASARALVGRARAEVLDAEGRSFVAVTLLQHLTGTRGRALEIAGPIDPADVATAPSTLRDQPDLLATEAAALKSERAAELARAAGKPVLSIGPSVTREATGDVIVLARVAFPLPLVSPAAFDTARARSEASVLRAEVRHARAVIERELDLALHERKHARELRDALKDGVLGPAREALRQALAQYEAGSIGAEPVLAARRELLSAEERWASAAADVRRADVRLMRLTGKTKGPR